MSLLTDEIRAFIGTCGSREMACEPVESGAIRRFCQATMDSSSRYMNRDVDGRFQGPVAAPLFPASMFQRALGESDPFDAHRNNPDFDGIVGSTAPGLPALPLPSTVSLLNGGTEVEIYRYAQVGERVVALSKYLDIAEKASSKGAMLIVVIETEYRTADGELLLKVRKTQLRR